MAPYPTFATLAPTAPQSPAAVSTPTFGGPPSSTRAAHPTPPSPLLPQPLEELSFFDPHFELPEHGTGLVEPGAYDDYNPLPALSFPPLPFTLPSDDALSGGGGPSLTSAPLLASSSSLFFPPPPTAAAESLFSFTESSALASFLTSSSDEPLFPPPPPLSSEGLPLTADHHGAFAKLVKSRGAWDFNPRLPDFMPVFGREEARRAGSFGSPAGRREGERGEEASRRLSGLRISPSPFGPSATASGPSSSPFRAGTASRSSSYDRNAIRSARTSLQQPSSILAPAGSRARALSPSSAAAASGGKPRSSSTTVADLLALDRLAAAGPASRTAAAHLTSSAGAATAGQVGLGFDVCYLRGSEAMAVSAQTAVFDSPTQPTTDLPAVQDAVALDVDGDREMTAAEDEIAQESRHAQAGSSCLSSRSTVGGERRMDGSPPPPTAAVDEDDAMAQTAPPTPEPVGSLARSRQSPPPPPPSAAAQAPKRVRSSAGSSLRGSSASVSRSPETPQGPLSKRQKSSIAPIAAAATRPKKAVVAPPASRVKAEEPDRPEQALDEGEEELDPNEPEDEAEEDRKGPKPLLTAEQKRTNHILSEQKRRNAIRTGYAELSHLLASSPSLPYPAFDSSAPTPSITTSRASTANKSTRGGARGGSKSNMLSRAAGLCRFLDDGNLALEEECVRIERLLGGR